MEKTATIWCVRERKSFKNRGGAPGGDPGGCALIYIFNIQYIAVYNKS